jgi:hypothetical protein
MKIFGLKGKNAAHKNQIQHASMLHVIANDPFLDWLLILVTAFAVTLTLVVIGASMYLGTGAKLAAPPPVVTRTAMSRVNTKALDTVLGEFDNRARERALPAKSYVAPKDPSLP